jgi:hypothetical protein
MGLLVVQVLDAVLDAAQEDIGAASASAVACGISPAACQPLQGIQRRARAQLRELAAAHDLQQLHGEFDLADAAARQLDIVGALRVACAASRCVLADLAVQVRRARTRCSPGSAGTQRAAPPRRTARTESMQPRVAQSRGS